MLTSYDYDAPIDEYGTTFKHTKNFTLHGKERVFFNGIGCAGLIRQPKWGHMKDLHAAIMLCEPALTAVDAVPKSSWLGSNQEVHILTLWI